MLVEVGAWLENGLCHVWAVVEPKMLLGNEVQNNLRYKISEKSCSKLRGVVLLARLIGSSKKTNRDNAKHKKNSQRKTVGIGCCLEKMEHRESTKMLR